MLRIRHKVMQKPITNLDYHISTFSYRVPGLPNVRTSAFKSEVQRYLYSPWRVCNLPGERRFESRLCGFLKISFLEIALIV